MTKRKPAHQGSDVDSSTTPNFNPEDIPLASRPNSDRNDEQTHFRGKKFKNSLDSDEEDDEVEATKYNMLNPDDLEGQEESTIERDGEIQITPFNMNEELEEGHFDKDGSFIFKKDREEIRDSWLDNIDWIKIKERPIKNIADSDSDDDEVVEDPTEKYQAMLEIMQPKETVQKALQRLGGKTRTASSRWKNKIQTELTEEELQNKEKFLQLTSLADRLVSEGNMEIYQQSYERLKFLVEAKLNPPPKFESTSAAADMFGDDFDVKKVANDDAQRVAEAAASGDSEKSDDSTVKWEFKWENKEEAEVYGPHPTSEIVRWIDEGYFKDGVWVRRVGEPNAPFYSSNRIDFDLYA